MLMTQEQTICSYARKLTVPALICSSWITPGSTARSSNGSCIVASGQLDSLLRSLGRFSEKLSVLGAHLNGDSVTTRSARVGPALIGQRLWQACSIDKVLAALLRERHFGFSVERAIFLSVLHRLFAPGSDRAAEKWKQDYAIDGSGQLNLHHLYRAMAWLGEALPKDQQNGATPFAPHQQRPHRGGVVRTTPGLVLQFGHGVLRYHLALLPGRRG